MPLQRLRFEEEDIKRIFRADTPGRKVWRVVRRTAKQLFFLAVLYGVFFFAINFSAFYQRLEFTVKARPEVQKEQTQNTPIIIARPNENFKPEIIIPKISITAPLLMNVAPDDIIEGLRDGVTHYQDTALPGQIGNSVVVGHSSDFPWSRGSYKNVFALLDKLTVGDQIIIPFEQRRFIYEVTGSTVVKPEELSVLRRTNEPVLTLITCYPVGSTRTRLIITAKLVGNPTTVQVNDPLIPENLPKIR